MFNFQVLTPGLKAKFEQFTGKVQRRIAIGAMRKGGRLIQAAAKANAPVDTGQLARNIKVKTIRYNRKSATQRVTVGVGEKWYVGDEFYAAFVEFGHKSGRRPKRKTVEDTRKEVPGEHYLEYAYDEVGGAAAMLINHEIAAGINTAIADTP